MKLAKVIDVFAAALDANGNPVSPRVRTFTRPVQPERFTPESAKDPATLAAQLTRVSKAVADATQQARSTPFAAPIIFRGVTVTSGQKVVLRHGLGSRVFWWLVGWSVSGGNGPPALVCDELDPSPYGSFPAPLTDANTLALRAYASGVADIAIMAQGA